MTLRRTMILAVGFALTGGSASARAETPPLGDRARPPPPDLPLELDQGDDGAVAPRPDLACSRDQGCDAGGPDLAAAPDLKAAPDLAPPVARDSGRAPADSATDSVPAQDGRGCTLGPRGAALDPGTALAALLLLGALVGWRLRRA